MVYLVSKELTSLLLKEKKDKIGRDAVFVYKDFMYKAVLAEICIGRLS